MQKGFSVLALLLIVSVLVVLPVAIYLFNSSSAKINGSNVMGASTVSKAQNGVGITVQSSSGSWDLYQFTCRSLDECQSSLEGGKRFVVSSGGVTVAQTVVVSSNEMAPDTKYVKVYVKPAWGSSSRAFTLFTSAPVEGLQDVVFDVSGSKISALIIPVEKLSGGFVSAAVFKD